MKERIKRHKGKTITGAAILSTMMVIFLYWSNVAPIVCQLLPDNVDFCLKTGAAAKALGKGLGPLAAPLSDIQDGGDQ